MEFESENEDDKTENDLEKEGELAIDFDWIVNEIVNKFGENKIIMKRIFQKYKEHVHEMIQESKESHLEKFLQKCEKSVFLKMEELAKIENLLIEGESTKINLTWKNRFSAKFQNKKTLLKKL